MIQTHEDICGELRDLRAADRIEAWTHRDCARAGIDIYTVVFHEGNDPRVVEWDHRQVKDWLHTHRSAEAILGAL